MKNTSSGPIAFLMSSDFTIRMVKAEGREQLALFYGDEEISGDVLSLNVTQDWNGTGLASATITVILSGMGVED